MNLSNGELHIWRYEVNETDYIAELNNPLLSNIEKARYGRFLNNIDAVTYVCNHRFMRKVLSLYLNILPGNIKFEYSAYGKPYLKDNLFFNLSYRNKFGIMAISLDNEVGVDIEEVRAINDIKAFTSLYFSDNEKEIIFNSDKMSINKKIISFWTLKEAVIKAQAKFVSTELCQIDLSEANDFKLLDYIDKDNKSFTIKSLDAPENYCAAFTYQGMLKQYKEYDYNSEFHKYKLEFTEC
jgi:4'-phosphopantetheinyl transferase